MNESDEKATAELVALLAAGEVTEAELLAELEKLVPQMRQAQRRADMLRRRVECITAAMANAGLSSSATCLTPGGAESPFADWLRREGISVNGD